MKNIKGFVMIETIIVITILTVGLISLYSSYSVILSRTKVKNNYDNIEYIYKAYFMGDYLIDYLIDNNINVSDFTIYKPDTSNLDLMFIMDKLLIDRIYVIPKNCDYKANDRNCYDYTNLDGSSIAYFNKWKYYDKNKINIIVKFNSEDVPSKINFASVAFNSDVSIVTPPIVNPPEEEPPIVEPPIVEPPEEELSKLADLILTQYLGKDNITEASAGIFAEINRNTENKMYKMDDNYGTSYYFRGAKDYVNNNIIFAEHQWKVVRINGDDSIRLIYNGTCPNNSCTINSTGTSTQIGTSSFNNNYDDAKYVGYMYSPSGTTASISRAQAVTNVTNSTIKTYLDNWYVSNIYNTEYEEYISDTLFCNDRRLRSEVGGSATGPGYRNFETWYAALYRLDVKKNPDIICGLKNDRFTVSDTIIGNGALTYPIGLLTPDEAAIAGMKYLISNSTNYLYNYQSWWTMGPSSMWNDKLAYQWYIYNDGKIGHGWTLQNLYGIRPVINLIPDVKASGEGTVEKPYIVKGL